MKRITCPHCGKKISCLKLYCADYRYNKEYTSLVEYKVHANGRISFNTDQGWMGYELIDDDGLIVNPDKELTECIVCPECDEPLEIENITYYEPVVVDMCLRKSTNR